MRPLSLLVVAAFLGLAACAQSNPPFVPNGGVSPVAVRAAKAKGPQYLISIILPRTVRPHGTVAGVVSLKAITYVGRKRYVDIVNANTACTANDVGGTFGGCGIDLNGTSSYKVKRALFAFYKAKGAKGCVLAQGELRHVTLSPGTVGVTMKPVNKKTCW